MMDDSFFIEYLRQKQYPSDLEKDILEKQLAALAAKEGWQKYGQ